MVLPLELYYDFKSNNNLEKAKYEYYLVKMYLKSGYFQEKTLLDHLKTLEKKN